MMEGRSRQVTCSHSNGARHRYLEGDGRRCRRKDDVSVETLKGLL